MTTVSDWYRSATAGLSLVRVGVLSDYTWIITELSASSNFKHTQASQLDRNYQDSWLGSSMFNYLQLYWAWHSSVPAWFHSSYFLLPVWLFSKVVLEFWEGVWSGLYTHIQWKISPDCLLSGESIERRSRSEDPHRCQQNFLNFFLSVNCWTNFYDFQHSVLISTQFCTDIGYQVREKYIWIYKLVKQETNLFQK